MDSRRPTALIALMATMAALVAAGPGAPPAAADTCYFPSSFFCQRISADAPIDPDSAAMVAEIRNMAYGVDPRTAFDCKHAVMTENTAQWTDEERQNCQKVVYRAGINYDAYAPMLYTVSADQGRAPVVLDKGDPGLKAAFLAGVPIPPEAQAASGTDGQLVIYQPSSDTMWEFWRARRDVTGAWFAAYGGVIQDVSQNPGHYEDSAVPFESHTWGGPSSSIQNLPGIMTIDQLRSGVIGHALVFSTWANNPNAWVYPAQRTDGRCQGASGQYCADVPQGARFRLDPGFDVSTIDHPIVRMIAKAVQDYGMVLNNTTGSGVSFYTEGWRGHPEMTDPYYGPGGLFTSDPKQLSTVQFMREFPWDRLQMLQRGTTCTNPNAQCRRPDGWPFAGSGTSSAQAPSRARVRLQLAEPRIAGSKLVVAGRARPRIAGTIAVACRCAGLIRGPKTIQADVRRGRFRAAFELAGDGRAGRYAVAAAYAGDVSHSKARTKRAFEIR